MEDLGQKTGRRLVKDQEEFIDPSFFKISFEINRKVFTKAVDGLLTFETEDLGELTDTALDKALDDCSFYRFTFLAAGAEVEAKIAQIERELNTWYAGISEQVRREIIKERQAVKKKDKIPSSWFGSITKQEIEHKILTDPQYHPVYQNYQNQLTEMRKYTKLLFGLRDILQDRGGHLQSIGRRRLENRKMTFGVGNGR